MSSASARPPEEQVEQGEDDDEGRGHDDLQSRGGALEVLELARPGDRDCRRDLHFLGDRALHVAHRRAQVAPADVHVDPACEPRVLALQHRRPVGDSHRRDVAQADLRAALGDHGQRAELLHRVAQLARVAHVDRKALQALDRLADVLAADRRGDDALHVGDVQAVARRRIAVDVHVDVAAAGEALGERRADPRHVLHRALDLAGDAVDLLEIGARDLHAHRALDAGGEHVDAVADRRHPDVGKPGHAHDRGRAPRRACRASFPVATDRGVSAGSWSRTSRAAPGRSRSPHARPCRRRLRPRAPS